MKYLEDDLYSLIVQNIPIVCVDIIPVKKNTAGGWQIGIITRATGSEAGKPVILGGRVYHNETIMEAISRTLETDLGLKNYSFLDGSGESSPFYVQQYLHKSSAQSPLGYDQSKHSIGLTYLVETSSKPRPNNEASDFYWITEEEVPSKSGYNHHLLMRRAFETLKSLKS